jgi:hypothetical protein
MDRDTIIRLARQAGAFPELSATPEKDVVFLKRFAALVAAAEREKVARWMMERGYATGHGDTTEDLLTELEWQVRESERKACAKACDDLTANEAQRVALMEASRRIRERSNK